MKFYQREKPYRYGARTVFFWKYKVATGRWKHGGQVYWGNRETYAITSPTDGLKRIAELSDGLERRDLIRKTAWLNRGVEDYSDAHFSKSIYLRFQAMKKLTPELPKVARPVRPLRRRKLSMVPPFIKLLALQGRKAPPETLRSLRETERQLTKNLDEQVTATILGANTLRRLGQTWETLTGHQRFLLRDFIELRPLFHVEISAGFWRLALSTWRNHPEPFKDFAEAHVFDEKWQNLLVQEYHNSA